VAAQTVLVLAAALTPASPSEMGQLLLALLGHLERMVVSHSTGGAPRRLEPLLAVVVGARATRGEGNNGGALLWGRGGGDGGL
jgi:hypothetical protein